MCDLCMKTPCHPRCPNAEIPPYYMCVQCGDVIDGSCYYKDNEYNFFCCESCALEFHGVELEYYDGDDDYDI